jgi:branched-chain amino acid transport system ATP-binding protein
MNRDGVIIHLYGCPTTEIIGGLTITEGASIALIGPNGAGKTSILRYIAFGRAPYPINTCKGTAGGFPIEKPRDSVRNITRIYYIPSERLVFPELTVEENIKLGMLAGGIPRSERGSMFEEIYSMFPLLRARRSQLAGTLSGGEQKILSIARAFSSRARVLLIDEPSAGLAPKAIDMVYEVFKRLRSRGMTLVIAEQSLWPLIRNIDVIDTVYIISDMKIVSSQKPKDLLESDIAKMYFGLRG